MNKLKYIVGLTGGIGSGKSVVTQFFSELGIDIVDADEVSRGLLSPVSPALEKVAQHFGQSILTDDNRLDRARLREIVFSNPEEKVWLESLLHPRIRQTINQLIDEASSSYIILSAPLLLENKHYDFVNRILVIDTPKELQLERVALRDNSSDKIINSIIDAQMSRKDRLARADDVIINNSNFQALKQQVLKLHDDYQDYSQHQAR